MEQLLPQDLSDALRHDNDMLHVFVSALRRAADAAACARDLERIVRRLGYVPLIDAPVLVGRDDNTLRHLRLYKAVRGLPIKVLGSPVDTAWGWRIPRTGEGWRTNPEPPWDRRPAEVRDGTARRHNVELKRMHAFIVAYLRFLDVHLGHDAFLPSSVRSPRIFVCPHHAARCEPYDVEAEIERAQAAPTMDLCAKGFERPRIGIANDWRLVCEPFAGPAIASARVLPLALWRWRVRARDGARWCNARLLTCKAPRLVTIQRFMAVVPGDHIGFDTTPYRALRRAEAAAREAAAALLDD